MVSLIASRPVTSFAKLFHFYRAKIHVELVAAIKILCLILTRRCRLILSRASCCRGSGQSVEMNIKRPGSAGHFIYSAHIVRLKMKLFLLLLLVAISYQQKLKFIWTPILYSSNNDLTVSFD